MYMALAVNLNRRTAAAHVAHPHHPFNGYPMLPTHLPRSAAALKRHEKRMVPQLAHLRQSSGMNEHTDLELVLYALGDESTKEALARHWRYGGSHPVTDMEEEDVRALDRSIAQAIVLAATCDPAAKVREKRPKERPGR
jgi:hypothetical protein